VPLKFNKLDMRDYLYHVYGVEVRAVRSFVSAQAPRQKYVDPATRAAFGPWFRPQSRKVMAVELAKPFVFPSPPEDLEPWDQKLHERITAVREAGRANAARGRFPLRDEVPVLSEDVLLAKEARAFLSGEKKWSNGAQLDEKWTEAGR